MENICFERVGNDNSKKLQSFLNLWLPYMYELGDDRSEDKIIGHAKKIIGIQENKQKENKIYNIELCMEKENIVGFCFFCIVEIEFQKDTEYGLIIKPLVNYSDHGYIMEFYIKPEYRLKNYGKIMNCHIEKIYGKHDMKKIMLTPNKEAQLFWEKLGYKNSGKIDPTNDLPIYFKDI